MICSFLLYSIGATSFIRIDIIIRRYFDSILKFMKIKKFKLKKIVVTGGSGLVGSELKKILNDALYPSSSEMNLIDPKSISDYLKK